MKLSDNEGQLHSRSYHRYFEDYAELEIPDDKGGYSIRRVYVGKYYRVDLPDRSAWILKIRILVLYLIAAALYFAAGLLSQVSASRYVAILTMLSLIAVLLLALPVGSRLLAPREMEIRSYRDSSLRLRDFSLFALVTLCGCCIGNAAGSLVLAEFSFAGSIPSVLMYFLSAMSVLLIYRTEKRTPYKILPPRNERPRMSSPIRYEESE
jgi:hypothetical protein